MMGLAPYLAPLIRSLVADMRSTGGVLDRMNPDELPRRLQRLANKAVVPRTGLAVRLSWHRRPELMGEELGCRGPRAVADEAGSYPRTGLTL
jgi:hypothetical protein